MVKHTKGPWQRNIKPARKYAVIFAGRNTHICALSVDGLTDEEIEANCNLIVAAPDLLDLARNVGGFSDDLLKCSDLNRMRAALVEYREQARRLLDAVED